MFKQFLKYLITVFLVIFIHSAGLAQGQSEGIQTLVDEMVNSSDKNEINHGKISKNPNVPLLNNEKSINNLSSDIKIAKNDHEHSIIKKYFKVQTGDNLNFFGSDEFNQKQDDNLFFFNTVGDQYQLAPGDVLQITLRGLDSSSNQYQIENDGTIIVEDLYPINIDGLNLKEVKDYISEIIQIDDASAEVFVSLKSARLVTVQISGNVNSPRTIAVPAYTPLSRVIAHAGGINNSGSLRNIYLSQSDENTKIIDFYEFLQKPTIITDPLIRTSARIFVPNLGPTVAATGFLARPGIYELKQNKVKVEELLKLTGTTFLPSGSTLKILFYDNDGRTKSRKVTKDEIIYQGESLKVDFIETREVNISKIFGSVVKDYTLIPDDVISVKSALKGGAALSSEAYTPFALIIGKNNKNKAINLNEALINENITLPLGADLKVFNQEEYMSLLSINPNKSSNPIVSKLANTEVAEIYLDGKLIAYIPPNENSNLSDSIKDFYKPTSKTVYDIIFLKNKNGVNAFSMNDALSSSRKISLNAGDSLFIFENTFFEKLLKSISKIGVDTPSNTLIENVATVEGLQFNQQQREKENILARNLSYSKKILQKANITEIRLDGDLLTILPYFEGINSAKVLETLSGTLPNIINEFTIITDRRSDTAPMIKNLNETFILEKNQTINLISNRFYQDIISKYYTQYNDEFFNIVRSSDAVKVYVDGRLKLLMPPYFSVSDLDSFNLHINNAQLYRLFITLTKKKVNSSVWSTSIYDAKKLFSKENKVILYPFNEIDLFTKNFIKKEFIIQNQTVGDINDFKTDSEIYDKDATKKVELAKEDDNNSNLEFLIDELQSKNVSNRIKQSKSLMQYSLKTIVGGINFQGQYPVADGISLSEFILSAGGLKYKNYNTKVFITNTLNQNGRLIRKDPIIIDYSTLTEKKYILDGNYYINIVLPINDAINGQIELIGELLRPGKYVFSRSETLPDIINRAGGLSDIAFPLGAVLQRESIKKEQIASNNLLADQLEASIISVVQTDIDSADDQVEAVLGFANQLRTQEVSGRLSLNILDSDPSRPIYLEDGDILTIPKRPSHVTVLGAVQNKTNTMYNANYSIADYVKNAGGLTKVADYRKTFILLPNGESVLTDNNTIIPVGSVIIVPPKVDKLSILGLTDILSRVLGNIATSILAINNVN